MKTISREQEAFCNSHCCWSGHHKDCPRYDPPRKAKLMNDNQLIKFATEFRSGIIGRANSAWMCAAVCWPLSNLLSLHGVKNRCIESDLGECNHVWIELEDGRALDPTADQFNWCNQQQMPPVYLGPPTSIHPKTAET